MIEKKVSKETMSYHFLMNLDMFIVSGVSFLVLSELLVDER
jgi:hypothetical protein